MNRHHFPLLKTVTYLDSAAGSLKPRSVVKAMNDYYLKTPINSRSDESRLGSIVTKQIIKARTDVAHLIDAQVSEVIFTSGTTDGLNRIAKMLAPKLRAGDEILLSNYNHASNVIPFLDLAKVTGAKIVYSSDLIKAVNAKTKLIAAAQVNNTVQVALDWNALYLKAQSVKAILINDAAQAIAHTKVSLTAADVIVFSSNKLYGPTGCGVLAVREALLTTLHPAVVGSGAISDLQNTSYTLKKLPDAFEPGTLNVAGIIGLGAGVAYFKALDFKRVQAHEHALATYAYAELKMIKNIKFYSREGDSIILFNIEPYHAQDVVSFLGHRDIILRGGLHCARLLPGASDFTNSVRLSLGIYNNKADLVKFITALKLGITKDFLDVS